MEHCSRDPRQRPGAPSYFSGKASRGFTVSGATGREFMMPMLLLSRRWSDWNHRGLLAEMT